MKKILICLLTVLFSVQMQGQSLDKIITEFSNAKNAESVNVGKLGWTFIKTATIGQDKTGIVNKISSVQVIDLSDCSDEIKSDFGQAISKLNDSKYELLLQAKDNEDEVLIISKNENDKIKELVIIDKTDPAIIRLKGKFDLNELSKALSINF